MFVFEWRTHVHSPVSLSSIGSEGHPPTQLPNGLTMVPKIHYVTVLQTKNLFFASYGLPMSPINELKSKLPVKPLVGILLNWPDRSVTRKRHVPLMTVFLWRRGNHLSWGGMAGVCGEDRGLRKQQHGQTWHILTTPSAEELPGLLADWILIGTFTLCCQFYKKQI